MVDRASHLENRIEERNGKNEALGRRLEKLRRDFGPVFLFADQIAKVDIVYLHFPSTSLSLTL